MSIAKSYAQALYQSASEAGAKSEALDRLESEFDAFIEAAGSSKEASIALYSPVVTAKEKTSIIEAVGAQYGFSPTLIGFLSLLARKGRFAELSRIRASFHSVRIAAEGGLAGTLQSAEPLSAEDVKELSDSFAKKLGKPIAFQATVDGSLLAGIKVTVGGVTYDGTLRAQLQQLRDRLVTGLAN